MRHKLRALGTLWALAVICGLDAVSAGAQCTHISGTPAPSPSLIASKVTLRMGSGGLFGDGNDRFKLLKGNLPTGVPVDLVATDAFHITIRHTDELGPTMLGIDLPPGPPWTVVGSSSRYLDPAALLGIRKIMAKDYGSGYYYKALGKDVSIASTPIATGDTIHLMIEIEHGGVGYCFGGILHCTAVSTGANCS